MDNDIVFNNFHRGIGKSAFLGFQEIRCSDITTKPGVIRANFALSLDSEDVVDGLIHTFKKDEDGNVYGCSLDKVFLRETNGDWSVIKTAGEGQEFRGLEIWKDYLFLWDDTDIDLYGPLSDTPEWTDEWAALGGNIGMNRPSLIGSDDVIYVAMGQNLGSITENGTFDGTTGTITLKNNADPVVTLPNGYRIRTLSEMGLYIMIGTYLAGSETIADIFPYDRSTGDYDTPLKMNENHTNQTIVVNNRLFIHAGYLGNWYMTSGGPPESFFDIPETLILLNDDTTVLGAQSIMRLNKRVYFGLGADYAVSPLGIYSFDTRDLESNVRGLNIEHLISTGNDGATDPVEIGAMIQIGAKDFLVAWYDYGETAYGVDVLSNSRYADDEAFFITDFVRVGTVLKRKYVSFVEVQLSKPLGSGDSVKVYVREAQNGDWGSPIATFSTVGKQSFRQSLGKNYENLQAKCVYNNEAEVFELRLI